MALSNKETIKIDVVDLENVVDLEKLYNFVVKNFLIWIRLGLQNLIWNFLCQVFCCRHLANKFFAECQTKTLGKEFLNLRNSNVVFAWQDDFKTKSYQLLSFITFWDLQSLFREFFHPRLYQKNQILKFSMKNVVLHDKMNSNKKVAKYKIS